LIAGLALLATVGYLVLTSTTSNWFERDVGLRARLAFESARTSLASHWHERDKLAAILNHITRDERIMAAAACSSSGETLATTDAFPAQFGCDFVRAGLREASRDEGWSTTSQLASGPVLVNALPLVRASEPIGSVVLVHDVSFIARREATTRNFLLIAFFILALGAATVTLLAARFAWRGWRWRETRRTTFVRSFVTSARSSSGWRASATRRIAWGHGARSGCARHSRNTSTASAS
jgi:trehalose 6-phosphate synthase